jgi:dienelactone hydrolase
MSSVSQHTHHQKTSSELMQENDVELRTVPYESEGVIMLGELAAPDGPGPFPGVLVMPDARGLGKLAKDAAKRLAALGYVALATDPYGGALFAVGKQVAQFHEKPSLLRSRSLPAYEILKAQPKVDPNRIAAIGYCFGGQTALELARCGTDLRCVVSFHGVLTTHSPAERGAVKGEILAITGLHDPYAPHAHVEAFRAEMVAAEARWQLTIYGNGWHQFTDPDGERDMPRVPGLRYDPLLDKLSWSATLALLEATLSNSDKGVHST